MSVDSRELWRQVKQTFEALPPSALVNEAFLKLTAGQPIDWHERSQFFGIAAKLMRQILIDHARKHQRRKGLVTHVPFDAEIDAAPQQDVDVVALDDALTELARLDPRQAGVVELRFFGGLTEKETANVLGISPATVRRDWATARLWLYNELRQE